MRASATASPFSQAKTGLRSTSAISRSSSTRWETRQTVSARASRSQGLAPRDDRFEGYLIVRSAEQRASANGKNYLDMTLADKSGSINAKMWDGTVQPPLAGSIVKVRATGNEFNGRMQLRVEKIRAAESRDAVERSLNKLQGRVIAPDDAPAK